MYYTARPAKIYPNQPVSQKAEEHPRSRAADGGPARSPRSYCSAKVRQAGLIIRVAEWPLLCRLVQGIHEDNTDVWKSLVLRLVARERYDA